MQYVLRDTDGTELCVTDEYNASVLRKDAGREVSKLLRRPGSHKLSIDRGGVTVATITIEIQGKGL